VTDRIVDLVADHADVTIRAGRTVDANLAARKIADVRRVLCAAPDYLAARGAPQSPAELAGHVCILLASQTPAQWTFRRRGEVEAIDPPQRLMTDSAECALRLALEGAGVVRLGDPSSPIRFVRGASCR
jgi:DNA-binding transcriptional LysR family regulator